MSKKCGSDKECGAEKICSTLTSRCIGKTTKTGKKEMERRSGGKSKVVKSPKVVKSVLHETTPRKKVFKRLNIPSDSESESSPSPFVKKKVSKRIRTPSPVSSEFDSESDDDLGSVVGSESDNNGSFIAKSPKDFSPCPSGKIRNPLTGHCVNKKGAIGKKILDGTLSKKNQKAPEKPINSFKLCKGVKCEENKLCNPLTGRCILKRSAMGQRVLREMASRPEFKKSRTKINCLERSKIKLNPHQLKTIEAFSKTDSMLVVHEPGMGKTLTAIAVSECYLDQYTDSNVVVITLVSLLENFDKEFKKFGGVDSSRYIFISYDTFLTEHKKLKERACKMFKNALVIIDEVHELRNFESNAFEAVMDCIKDARKVLLLTATPYVNTVCDFIPIVNLLNRKYVIGLKGKIKNDNPIYMAPTKIVGCKTKTSWTVPSDPTGLIKQIKPFLVGKVSFAEKEANPLYPKEKLETILIPMQPSYERDFLTVVPETGDAFYGLRRTMVNALGEDYYSNKLTFPRILEMVSKKCNRNVIFTSWIEHGLKHISKIFDSKGLKYGIISGDVKSADRARIVREYNSGKINNLIITTAGMAGIDLVGVTNIIVIDPVWNDANLRQIIGRGVRFKSHCHLPEEEQIVHVYLLQLVERAIYNKTMDIKKSRSGDLILYKFIEKKARENKYVIKMLKEVSVI